MVTVIGPRGPSLQAPPLSSAPSSSRSLSLGGYKHLVGSQDVLRVLASKDRLLGPLF